MPAVPSFRPSIAVAGVLFVTAPALLPPARAFDVKPGEALYLPPDKRVRIW